MKATLTITCPHCLVSNRVPAGRLQDAPNCGKCHQALFTGQPLPLETTSFNAYMKNNQTPVVVDFWADWCGPCKQMAPAFEQASAELEPHYRLCKLDTEKYADIAGNFNIRGIPTLIMFENGKEVARQSGMMPAATIIDWVKRSASE